MDLWSGATGKKAAFFQVDAVDWVKAFGDPGGGIYRNLKAFEENDRWAFDNSPLSGKNLGIKGELVGTRACLEGLKKQLL